MSLQTVCLRHRPERFAREKELTAHNLAIADSVNRSGRAYLTPSVLKGRQILRVSIGAEPTERRHVEDLWEMLTSVAARLARSYSPR